MNTTELPVGSVVLLTSTEHLSPDQRCHLQEYVEYQMMEGKPVLLPPGFDLHIRQAEPTITKVEHYARVNELLEANNAYQERYRAAETRLLEMGVDP